MKIHELLTETWSQKYKKSINCSHPKGFSQKAHCAGKKKHNESVGTEMVCEDCGMCETHGDHSHDNLDEACWKGYHKDGMKTMFGKRYPNCVKNKKESLETYIRKGECPGCGEAMVAESQLNEKQDACYHKVKSRYKVWPSAYASGALVQCRKKGAANWGNSNESITQEEYDALDENLKKWFSDKWVRFGPDGKIKGDCARGDSSEGKPKCLPQSKAHSLGKKGRASAASRKRRQDPNPERSGPAINVKTKKEDMGEGMDELARILELSGLNLSADEQFDIIEDMVESLALQHGVDVEQIWEDFESVDDQELLNEAAAWQTSKGKSKTGGLNAKGVASYRRENPGSKLQMAVTTKPSKLKPGSKAAKRRKSFCARMSGNKGPMKKPNGKPTRKALALRKWNC